MQPESIPGVSGRLSCSTNGRPIPMLIAFPGS